jgi:hypothetical protein
MKALIKNQPVKYVDEHGKIIDATILDPKGYPHAHVQLDGGIALAAYNPDKKTKNTFHFADDPDPKPAEERDPAPNE